MKLTTNSKILVTVDEALQDILVVSYACESKLFQGVLLDSTKRFLPCRIPHTVNSVSPISSPKTETSEEDKLFFSIRQRFTYFQEKPVHLSRFHITKNAKLSGKYKNQKMTVRLRPRQVLCSKCKSVCNENSENVDVTAKNRTIEPPDKSPRQLLSENRRENQPPTSPSKLTLIPRLSRLQPNEITSAMKGNLLNPPISRSGEDYWIKPPDIIDGNDIKEPLDHDEMDKQMVLRKKRSVGSMEDLWDETVFEEGSKKAKTTPVIKISFGSQGEGTVLKIPSKVQTYEESETDDSKKTISSSKAAKKALKKAKKEARRKILASSSPPRIIGGNSPAHDSLQYRKHRHKVKHKKKHKMEKETSDNHIKEKCLKQKLSINLKRLTSTTYQKTEEDSVSGDSSQSEEEMPDFPVALTPSTTLETVSSCQTVDGSTFNVGDIVWGKIQGFPWWPGKVISITIQSENNSWDAHVSWYGSTTSSMMPCDQLSHFLQTFKIRFNKKKKSSSYREAIRQATNEASGGSEFFSFEDGQEEEEEEEKVVKKEAVLKDDTCGEIRIRSPLKA